MAEYGIWTENNGGFTERGLYTTPTAETRLAEIIAESDDPDTDRADLSIVEMCPDHADNDQPKHGCQDCES